MGCWNILCNRYVRSEISMKPLLHGFARYHFIIFFLTVFALPLFGEEASTLLESASLLGKADRAVYMTEMEIFTNKSSKTRNLTIYKESDGPDVFRLMAQVTAPAFLTNMKLLVLKEGQQESRWMKTSRGVRSIAVSGRKEQIFDSDMDTEDLVDIESDLFTISLKEDFGDIVSLLAYEKATGYSRVITMDRMSKLIMHIDYYDAANTLYKTYHMLESSHIEDYTFPKKGRISSIKEKTYTELTFTSVELPTSIPSRIFNRHQL